MSKLGVVAPRLPPDVKEPDAKAIARWTAQELDTFTRRFNLFGFLQFKVLHAEPENPRQGLVVYADGADWDPASGEGLYVYKSGGWTLIA